MSVNITNNLSPGIDTTKAPNTSVRHGNLDNREVINLTGNQETSLEKLKNTSNRMSPDHSVSAKRQKLQAIQLDNYCESGRTLSRKLYKLTVEEQKAHLVQIANTNTYAGYLLAEIFLKSPSDPDNTHNAIILLRNFLEDVKEQFGEIDLKSELSDEYFYAHYLLGSHLKIDDYHEEIKEHYLIASKGKEYKYTAGVAYGDMLYLEENREQSIQHWKKMIGSFEKTPENREKIGYLYNRLGCSLVAEDNPTIEDLEQGVKAFKKGMENFNNDAQNNWSTYKKLLPTDVTKFIAEYSESASEQENNELSEIESMQSRDIQAPNATQVSDIASQHTEVNEPSDVYSIHSQEQAPPLSAQAQEILDLLKEAASYGNIDAIHELAVILTEGKRGIPANLKEALPHWDQLAKEGQSSAYMKQADIFISLSKTEPESLQWITGAIDAVKNFKALDPESTEPTNNLLRDLLFQKAEIYLNQNPHEADCILESLKESAGYGNRDAVQRLATILTEGYGAIQKNLKEALPYWGRLAQEGQSTAYMRQADIFISLAKTNPEPLQWLTSAIDAVKNFKAAKPDASEHSNKLIGDLLFQKAEIYLNQNPLKADCILESLKESAGYLNLDAVKRLATILTEGHGSIPQNLKEALPYWEQIAKCGDSSAYLKQVDILVKIEQESIELINKVLQLLKLFKESEPENTETANRLLGTYLFKKAQILLKS